MDYMEQQPTSRGVISTAIRTGVEARGMTLRDLAGAVGISPWTLRRYMAHEGSFVLPDLERICDVLGLDLVAVVSARDRRRTA